MGEGKGRGPDWVWALIEFDPTPQKYADYLDYQCHPCPP